MTASAASSQFQGAPRPGPRLSTAGLLAQLEANHIALRERIAALGAVTDRPLPSKMEYTSARLRLSQASIDRRSTVNKILRFLEERAAPGAQKIPAGLAVASASDAVGICERDERSERQVIAA